ncbi:MAG: hypothetical protein QM594_22700 [Niabella sp.]
MGIVELIKERETNRLIEKGAEQKSYEFVKKIKAGNQSKNNGSKSITL